MQRPRRCSRACFDLGEAHGDKHGEITRFNEAIDETLAQAAVCYSEETNHTKEPFVGILGHDLRNPLTAVIIGFGLDEAELLRGFAACAA